MKPDPDIEKRAKAIYAYLLASSTKTEIATALARRERRLCIKAFQLGRMEVLLSDPVQKAMNKSRLSEPEGGKRRRAK